MTEQLISFETAKLAKEKGFEIPVKYFYSGNNEKFYSYGDVLMNHNDGETEKTEDRCSAPTQSLLQKWLREEHNLNIGMEFSSINNNEIWNWRIHYNDTYGSSKFYEEALEKALISSLKLI